MAKPSAKPSANASVRLLPLGGLGEIGMNCLVIETRREMLLVDCGILFPDIAYPGVELFVPDLSYVLERIEKLRGVVITHGHEDHIGAVPYLMRHTKLDIYCTPFPQGLLEQKFAERHDLKDANFHRIKPLKTFEVGSFRIEPIPVQHSIIEALGLAIETPVGTIIHSGDFKHDPTPYKGKSIDFKPFARWGKKGVQLLLSDSTNAEQTGHSGSEEEILHAFESLFKEQTTRLFIALFASNIRRVGNFLEIASRMKKKVALVGRSMNSYTRLAHEQGAIRIPEDTLILPEDLDDYLDDEVVVLATGSQAEPQSALVRMSQGIHRDIEIRRGDHIVMSSRFIPGNERNIHNMINQLYRLGAEVTYRSLETIHVSGHGYEEDLQLMLKACRPKHFIPVHGEYRHLAKHRILAIESGVAEEKAIVIEDGQSVHLSKTDLRLSEKYDLKRLPIVMGIPMHADANVFTERQKAAKAGVVFLQVLRSTRSGKLIQPPKLSTYGLLFRKEADPATVLPDAVAHLEEVFENNHSKHDIGEVLRVALRRFLKTRVSYKPIVIPIVLDI